MSRNLYRGRGDYGLLGIRRYRSAARSGSAPAPSRYATKNVSWVSTALARGVEPSGRITGWGPVDP